MIRKSRRRRWWRNHDKKWKNHYTHKWWRWPDLSNKVAAFFVREAKFWGENEEVPG